MAVMFRFLRLPVLAVLFVAVLQSNAGADVPLASCSPAVAYELEELKLAIFRLESILDERIEDMNVKNNYISECERKIVELMEEIGRLNESVSRFRDDSSRARENLDSLEEEVRLLWEVSRKNNFDIHELEYKALDAVQRLKELTNQVEKMAEIVTEQWIQIQQLEQAVHMAQQIRTFKVQQESGWRKCPFVKSSEHILGDHYENLKRMLDPYARMDAPVLVFFKSQVLHAFKAHHQLQGCIKLALKSNELTAALAHDEVVFIMASTLVAFPVMIVCLLLLVHFSSI